MPRLKVPPPAPLPAPLPASLSSRGAALVSRALAHVDAHLDERLDADTLADRAAMSRHHFHRMFNAYVGCSVGSYVIWRRLQRACALLASGDEPVLDVALSVGYESAQALAKAMRRELGTTPTAVRRGDHGPWTNLLIPERLPAAMQAAWASSPIDGEEIMQVTRYTELPAGIEAITATARGMVDNNMARAASAAFQEVGSAVGRAGLMPRAGSWLSIVPDDAQGPDDPHCRYVAGVVFGYDMARETGRPERPDVPLSGTLAWQRLVPGRYAVFTHIGPYTGLHKTWQAIYRDWLPTSGERLRDAPPMGLCLNSPEDTPPEKLHTEIWIPVEA